MYIYRSFSVDQFCCIVRVGSLNPRDVITVRRLPSNNARSPSAFTVWFGGSGPGRAAVGALVLVFLLCGVTVHFVVDANVFGDGVRRDHRGGEVRLSVGGPAAGRDPQEEAAHELRGQDEQNRWFPHERVRKQRYDVSTDAQSLAPHLGRISW